MKRVTQLLLLLVVILANSNAIAAKLGMGEQTGDAFTYDNSEEYVSIDLKELNLPSIDDNTSKLAKFFKSLFLDRKRYGVAYIEVIPAVGKIEKTILFTYSMEDKDHYSYKYVGANGQTTYQLSRPFIYSDSVDINIVIKEWEDETASSAVKTILGATKSSNITTGYENILSNITVLLDLVEALFPADSTQEALNIKLNPDDIHHKDIQIYGDNSNFFKISLRSNRSFFEDFDIQKGLQRAKIQNIEAWKQVISSADNNLSSDGLEPLIAAVQSYADYVLTLPLNKKDQAILTACSINAWANDAVKGNVIFDNKSVQFTAHDYSGLPTASLKTVRGLGCDFTGVNCNTSHCLAMSDFINKSSRSNSRRVASNLYLDGELNITFSNNDITLTPDEYITSFRIGRPAFFEIESTGPNSWSYHFDEDALDLKVEDKRYKPYKIRIDLLEEEGKHIIAGIEVYAPILLTSKQ